MSRENDIEVDMDSGQFGCDRQCWKEGFKYFDIASAMVEDDGELHTVNIWKHCYNWRKTRRRNPR